MCSRAMSSDDPDEKRESHRIPVESPDEDESKDQTDERSEVSDSSNVTLGPDGIDTAAYSRKLKELKRQLKQAEGEAKQDIQNELSALKSTLREQGVLEKIRGDNEETPEQEASKTGDAKHASETSERDQPDGAVDDSRVDNDNEQTDTIEVSGDSEENNLDGSRSNGETHSREHPKRAQPDTSTDPSGDVDESREDEHDTVEPTKEESAWEFGESGERADDVEDGEEQDTTDIEPETSEIGSVDDAEASDKPESEETRTAELSPSDRTADAHDTDEISNRLRRTEQRVDELETLVGDLRRKNEREHEMLKREALEDFASRLLKIRDTLDRAIEYNDWSAQDEQLIQGIVQQFDQEFTSGSIELIDPDPGDEIDEVRHAFAGPRESSEQIGPNRVLRVEQKGFEVSGYPLRRAKIIASERE